MKPMIPKDKKINSTLKSKPAKIKRDVFTMDYEKEGLTVSLSLCHWYPVSGVVLDCIDS